MELEIDVGFPLAGSYVYKGSKYSFQGYCEFKCPSTRKWVRAVSYSPWDNPDKLYVREEKDFLNKFKKFFPEDRSSNGVF